MLNLKFDLLPSTAGSAVCAYNENAFEFEMNFHQIPRRGLVFIVQLGSILLLTKQNSMQVISTWSVVVLHVNKYLIYLIRQQITLF